MRLSIMLGPNGGIETISLISNNEQERQYGLQMHNLIQPELDEFERKILAKLEEYEKKLQQGEMWIKT